MDTLPDQNCRFGNKSHLTPARRNQKNYFRPCARSGTWISSSNGESATHQTWPGGADQRATRGGVGKLRNGFSDYFDGQRVARTKLRKDMVEDLPSPRTAARLCRPRPA